MVADSFNSKRRRFAQATAGVLSKKSADGQYTANIADIKTPGSHMQENGE
jgi:hypothetical protein